ncbi:MAG: signal recognition particle protein Srp54 [Candidatus Odinarchaeia archaeon]
MVLEGLGKSLTNAIRKLIRAPLVDEKAVKEFVKDLQRALLEADTNVELVLEISQKIEKKALEVELPPGITRREYVLKLIYDELASILGRKSQPIRIKHGKRNIIMLVGIQGSGKTTTCAKLANYFKKRGTRVGIIGADTFRLGAYEQLKQLADKIEVPFYGEADAKDAIKIVKNGLSKFNEKDFDLIIIDTTGRHKEEKALFKEMISLSNKIKPDEIILVIDGTLGQQAAIQAEAFNKATNIGSIIVTKLDGSGRGGGALSAVAATGAPIKFIGIGEKIGDIESFNPESFVSRLLGMSDLKTLLEKIKEAEIQPDKETAKTFLKGKFTLKDMMTQMENFKKVGTFGKIMGHLGLGSKLPEGFEEETEAKLETWKIIMQSMTKEELEDPKIINRSRIFRIARGSGTMTKDVKELLNQYNLMKKFAKSMGKRRGLGKMGKLLQKQGLA